MLKFLYRWKTALKRIGLAIVAILLVISILGLGGNKEEDMRKASMVAPTGDAGLKKVEENKVFLSTSPVSTWNPIISGDEDSYYISKLIYDSLFQVDGQMNPVKKLVKNYSYNDKTLSLTLTDKAFWHDGQGKLQAEDVVYTIKAIKLCGKNTPYYYKAKAISKVRAKGDNKVEIVFKKNNNMGLDLLTFPILPKHQYNTPIGLVGKKKKFKFVGSGPFKCTNMEEGQDMVLEPNEKYMGKKARSIIKVKTYDDQQRRNKLVEASNISLVKDSDFARTSNISKEGVKFKNYPDGRVYYIAFNMKEKHVEKANVRKAVALAIDNQEIIENCFYNSAIKSDSLFIPEFLGSKKRKDPFSSDTEKAEATLEISGYRDTNGDGIVENDKYQPLVLSLLVNYDNDTEKEIGKIIKNNLKKAGVNVRFIRANNKNYESILKKGKFSMYLGWAKMDEGYDYRKMLDKNAFYNYISYENEELEELYDHMRSGVTPDSMRADLEQIKKILDQDLPYYCIGHVTCGIMLSPAIKGEIHPNFSDIYRGAETWFSTYERRIEDKDEKAG